MKSLHLTKPHLIVVVGIPGAGKTHFAQQFSSTFNAPFLRYEDLFEFSNDANSVDAIWNYVVDKLTQTRQTALLEGPSNTQAERRIVSDIARRAGYQPLFIWVQTEPATAEMRATRGVGRVKPQFPISSSEFKERSAQFEPLLKVENYIVISGKHTYASQAKNVLQKLTQTRKEVVKISTKPPRPTHNPVGRAGRISIN